MPLGAGSLADQRGLFHEHLIEPSSRSEAEAPNPREAEFLTALIDERWNIQFGNRQISEPALGLRYDKGKNRLDLIPPEWIWELGKVLTAGANKYADRNWELGMRWSKVVGPIWRHLIRFLCGEQLDKETGCHHLAHVAWNALALLSYDLRSIGEDDLGRKDFCK